MHVHPVLGEPTLMLAFEGWNDACEAASSAVSFVNSRLRGVPLAEIDSDDYYDFTVRRPLVQYQAGKSSAITWPTNEFRYGVTDEGLELITGLGVEPHMRWRSYCEAIVELAATPAKVLFGLGVGLGSWVHHQFREDENEVEVEDSGGVEVA